MRKPRIPAVRLRIFLGLCWLALLLTPMALVAQTQTLQFALPTFSVYENQTNVTVVVTRAGGVSGDISVDFATQDGVAMAPGDYTATNGTLMFADGEVVKLFQVFITPDMVTEGDEIFGLVLSNPNGAELGFQSTAEVLIFDDDTMFTFSSATYRVAEDGTNAVITVLRNPASGAQASVVFLTADCALTNPPSALAGVDYTSITTNLLFTNGQTSVEVFIPIANDCFVETNGECFQVLLTNAVGAMIGPRASAVVTITDDDTAAGSIEFAFPGPRQVLEGFAGTINIGVSRVCGTRGAVSVQYRIQNRVPFPPIFPTLCNGQIDARTNLDFTGGFGTLNWADQDGMDKSIPITILDEDWVELNECIIIELFNPLPQPNGPNLGGVRQFKVIIVNDDLAAGMADPFYNALTLLNPTPGANNTVYAVAAYPAGSANAGKSVIGGDFTAVNAIVRNGVARLNLDGSVDATFDPGSGADGFVAALFLQSDGKVLVGGGFTSMDNLSANGLARLNVDGSLDGGFNIGAGVNGSVYGIDVQGDGKILIAGDFTTFDNNLRHNVARLNGDGTLDETFDAGNGPDDVVYAVAVQSGGKIMLAGAFTHFDGVEALGVTRLDADGSQDTTFTPVSGADNVVYAMKIQPDGKAVIGGAFASYDGESRRSVARLNFDGTLDATFDPGSGVEGIVYAIALQANVQAVIGGDFTVFNQTGRTNYARLLLDGTLDTSFLDNYYNQAQPGTDHFVAGVAVQPDGNVLLGGSFSTVGGGTQPGAVQIRFNVARVVGGATLPAGTESTIPPGNSPGNLEFISATYNVDEHVLGGALTVTARRVNGTLGALTVDYFTSDGSAKSNVDYMPVSGSVVWGDCSAGIVLLSIPILDNQVIDGNKTFYLTLANPRGTGIYSTNQPALGFQYRTLVTVVDNDVNYGVLGFSKPIFEVNEAGGLATITVTRTNGSTSTVNVDYSTANGTAVAPGDYSSRSNRLTFGSGVTNRTFTFPIINDTAQEFEESVHLTLFNATGGATLGLTNATLLIFSDESGSGSVSLAGTDFSAEESSGTASVNLRRNSGSTGEVSVLFYTSDLPPGPGAARSGTDYLGVTNVVTFAYGITNVTVPVTILPDTFVEGNERFLLTLTNVVGGASLGFIKQGALTVVDDDAYGKIALSQSSYFINETETNIAITLVRTDGRAEEVTVDYIVTAGTATEGADYFGPPGGVGTITFADGETLRSFAIDITDDALLEGNETIFLTLTNFAKASRGSITNAVLTIVDDEALAVTAGSVDTFFDPTPGPNDLVNAVALQPDGKMIVGGEFTAFSGYARRRIARVNVDGSVDLSFNPVQGANDAVRSVIVQPDGKVLVAGRFTTMGNRNRASVARLTTAGLLDTSFNPGAGADNPVFAMLLQSDGRILLGGDFASYNGVLRNRIARINSNGMVDYTFAPGLGADGAVFALAQQSDGRILVAGDFTTFDNQPFRYLARLNTDGSLDTTFGVGALTNGPNGPVRALAVQEDDSIIIGGLFTAVDGTNMGRIARLSADGRLDASFDPGVGADGSVNSLAIQNNGRILVVGDFLSLAGLAYNRIVRLNTNGTLDTTIDFGSGANSYINTVVLQTDEQIVIGGGFTMVGGLPRNYLARLVGGENITPGTFEFTAANYNVLENATNVTVTLLRNKGSQGSVSVTVVSQDNGSALAGQDYIAVSNRFDFTNGETVKTITVTIVNDPLVETNETFSLIMTNVSGGALLGEKSVTKVTILNDDSSVGFNAPTYSANEGIVGGNVVIGVVKTGATNAATSVSYATRAGSAGAGGDYGTRAGLLTFLPGQTNLIFTVPIVDDTFVEGSEIFHVVLTNATGSFLALSNATVTIIDNDFSAGNLTFSQPAYFISEGAGAMVITVLRTNGTTGVVTAGYGTSQGTATADVDYGSTGGLLTFADGQTSQTITVPIINDFEVEGDETFVVTLGTPSGSSTVSGSSNVVVTIQDDEFGPGSVDRSFNPGSGANALVRSLALQSDGKLIVGGGFSVFDNLSRNNITRLNANGSQDPNFIVGTGANAFVSSVSSLPNNQVVLGGFFTNYNGVAYNRLARLNTNGTPDVNFNQPSGLNAALNTVLAQANGRIVVGGGFSRPTRAVARIRVDGSVDTTFNPGSGADGPVHAFAIYGDGRVIIGGALTNVDGLPRARVARLAADGSVDASFSAAIISNGVVYAAAIQDDGKVVLGGDFTLIGRTNRTGLVRVQPDGTLDDSFDPGTGANAAVFAVALQSSGKLIVAGDFTTINGTNRNRFARLNRDGTVDTTFDPGRGANNTVYSVVVQTDDNILLGGDFSNVSGVARNGVARIVGSVLARLAGITLMPGPSAQLTLNSQPGLIYVLEASTDLTHWQAVQTNAATGVTLEMMDPTPGAQNARFYRVRTANP